MGMQKSRGLICGVLLLFTGAAQSLAVDVDRIMSAAATKLAAHDLANENKSLYPNQASNVSPVSSWETIGSFNWVSGFYPGALWQMYDYSGDAQWRDRAAAWTAGIEGQKSNTGTHDLGFMVNNSFGNGYRMTGEEDYRDVVLTASESLSRRYDPDVGMVRAWGSRTNTTNFLTIIDTMMNLEMLFWSARNGGGAFEGTPDELYGMAVSHADQTRANHVRADGSSFHIVNYDPVNGDIKRQYTGQGKSDDSTWTRGQAWGIHGFATTYRETGEARFLETARGLADFFLDNLPADGVPLADFSSEHTTLAHKDSTAAAIAASGLFELSRIETEATNRERYFDAGVELLTALTSESSDYFSSSLDESPGLLLHGSRRYRASDPGDDSSYVWGDYYLIEATLRYASLSLPGDFDFDRTLTANDIDRLAEALRSETDFYRYDLNLDGVQDDADLDAWVSEAYGTFPGDANLDYQVEFDDFLTMAGNFGEVGGWAEGDFNGDALVDFSDFVALSKSFGLASTTSIESVPEPGEPFGALAVTLCLWVAARRKRA